MGEENKSQEFRLKNISEHRINDYKAQKSLLDFKLY